MMLLFPSNQHLSSENQKTYEILLFFFLNKKPMKWYGFLGGMVNHKKTQLIQMHKSGIQ